ncbi:MAG: zf-HC2 domain-containing protein [Bryobacteraceae bacterium]
MSDTTLPHPGETDLLTYADGELSPHLAAQIDMHLAGCGPCRNRLEQLRADLENYIQYHNSRKMLAPAPPKPWADMRSCLRELDAEHVRPRREPPSTPFTRWAAVAAGLALALLIYRLSDQRTVNAAELLEKASAAAPAHSPGRKIHVKTRDHSFTRPASFKDDATPASKTAAQGEDHAAVLRALFEEANYSWDDPLSARSFAAWRNQLPQKSDDVSIVNAGETESGRLYRIRTTTSYGTLAEASLVMRAVDLHPVSETLQFRNKELVEITESLPEPQSPTPNSVPPPQIAANDPSPSGKPPRTDHEAPGPAEELRVLAALNRIGADLGEPIEVVRDSSAGKLRVTGLGLDPARRRQIRASLEHLPDVDVRFEDPQPVKLEGREADVSSAPMEAPDPLRSHLELKLGGSALLDQFINRVLEQSEAALARAHALRKLASRFPPDVEGELEPPGLQLLFDLRDAHLAALAGIEPQLVQTLSPLLGELLPDAQAVQPCSPWQDCTEPLLESTQNLDRVLNLSLASARPNRSPEQALPEMRQAAIRWRQQISVFQETAGKGSP